jgi:hypothetical protein
VLRGWYCETIFLKGCGAYPKEYIFELPRGAGQAAHRYAARLVRPRQTLLYRGSGVFSDGRFRPR